MVGIFWVVHEALNTEQQGLKIDMVTHNLIIPATLAIKAVHYSVQQK